MLADDRIENCSPSPTEILALVCYIVTVDNQMFVICYSKCASDNFQFNTPANSTLLYEVLCVRIVIFMCVLYTLSVVRYFFIALHVFFSRNTLAVSSTSYIYFTSHSQSFQFECVVKGKKYRLTSS